MKVLVEKFKLLIAVVAILLISIIFNVIDTSETKISKVSQDIQANSQNLASAEAIDNSEIGKKGIISSATIIDRVTGTGPFDSNDNPGNDSSEDNDIVRSFDQVIWTVDITMALKDNVGGTALKGGKIEVEAQIPENCANVAIWDLDSMGWLEGTGEVSQDGRTLTGSYTLSTTSTTIPGKQTLILVLKVEGAQNGTTIKPTFNFKLEGNEDSEKYILQDEAVTVSAAPKYNVQLKRNTYLAKEYEFTENDTTYKGRMYGYTLIYQLYNDGPVAKGLKGIEYSEGDINLDVNLKFQKISTDGTGKTEDITDSSTPMLYNYKMNIYNDSSGYIPNRPMGFVYHSAHEWQAPGAFGGGARNCYDSGKITMEQQGSTIKTTLSGYKFNGEFPTEYVGQDPNNHTVQYAENIGCFSTAYFQIFVPYTEESSETEYNYYLTVEDANIEAYSNSGTKLAKQTITSDDSNRVQHVLFRTGSFTEYHWLENNWGNYGAGGGLYSHYTQGDAKAAIGQKFIYRLDVTMGRNNDIKDDIYDANELMKFDGEVFKITQIDGMTYRTTNKSTNSFGQSDMKFKMLYVAKKDGTNWTSDEEMKNATEEDLLFFTSEEELQKQLGQNAYCVGVLFESTSGTMTASKGVTLEIALEVSQEAEVGKVYQFLSTSRLYTKENELDRTTQTRENPNAVFPSPNFQVQRNYIKTEYDSNGNIIEGTHNGSYEFGQSLLIISGKLTVDHSIEDKTESGETKVNYDIGRNENLATLSIKPTLSLPTSNAVKVSGITIKVTENLPKGLTYESGSSNHGEPQITNNEDGTQTLIWNIYDCTIGEDVPKITFKARIDEETENGTQYTSTVLVSADNIGASLPSTRTDSLTIQITNLSAHRLYKEVETPVIEKNGEIKYKITYENKTDEPITEFQLLDILPYIGDNRGTNFQGTYTLQNINVKQYINEQAQSTDKLKIYTTTSDTVKTMNAKNEQIGTSSIWQERVNGATINSQIKGIAVKGEVPGLTRVEVEISLKTNGNQPKDIYANDTMAQVYSNSEQMQTAVVNAIVVNRSIEGTVWKDENRNGLIDDEEKGIEGITVKLINTNTNREVSSQKTGQDGTYNFQDLEKANYKIGVEYDTKYYELTTKNVGENIEINSKFNKETNQTDEITKLNSIQTPEIKESYVNAGIVNRKAKIIVQYIEEGTNKKLASDTEITDKVIGDTYETTPQNIEGYINTSNSGNTQGTCDKEEIIVKYYYKNNKQKIVVSKSWDDNNDEHKKRPTQIKIELKQGNNTIAQKTISSTDNWKGVFENIDIYDKNLDEIKYTVDETEVNTDDLFYYTKEIGEIKDSTSVENQKEVTITNRMSKFPGYVTVKYVDINTKQEISTSQTVEGIVGEQFDISNLKKEIGDYTLVQEPEKTGTYTENTQERIYYYAKNTHLTVKYLEKDTNAELAEPDTIEGYEGKDYETQAKSIPNYTCVDVQGNAFGKMPREPIEIIYYYAQNTTVRVEHIDRQTGEILKEVIEKGKVGDLCKTHPEDIEGYVLVQEPEEPDVIMTKEEQVVKYYYAHISEGIIEKHIDEITGELIYSQTHKGNEGDPYNIPSKEFEGYDLVEEKLPTNAQGVMTKELIEVKYYYIKKANVRVEYIDKTYNQKLTEDVIINGHENDSYITEEKQFDGYNLVEKPENAEGTMKITKNEDGTYNVETVVTYYYKKQAGGVTENHIDIISKEKLAEETHEGNVGDSYNIPSREFEGYDLVEEENGKNMLPENAQGEMTEEEITVDYYYKRKAVVKVEYIDSQTEEKLYETQIDGHEKDKYKTEEKQFDQYDLIEIPSNAEGEMTKEEIVVKYYYIRKAEVEIQYVEKDTNAQLLPKAQIEGHVNDKYKTEPKEVEYYKLVGQTENTEGTMQIDKITVIYYYEKQTFNLGISKWVSKVNIDGVPQNAQNYNQRGQIYKVDIHRNKIDKTNIKITYTIRVENTGEIEGNATRITEIMPQGYSYHQEDNQITWQETDGILTTDTLKDTVIKPGESKEIDIVFRWNGGDTNLGEKQNTVILSKTSNPAGYEDNNSQDDTSKSEMLITVATGLDSNDRAIMIAALQILILVAIGLMFGRKKK